MTSFARLRQWRKYGSLNRLSDAVCRVAADTLDCWLPQPSYGWPHPVLFIAGLPKSGTTWLAQLLGEVPGYRVRQPADPDECVAQHDVCEAVFAALPWNRYSVVKFHTRFTEANLAVIEKFNMRTIVMYRDLRDQCVSRYFHVLYDPTHRHHTRYREASQEAGLAHCIEVTIEEYLPWVQGWLPYIAACPDRFHEVRYEDLRANPEAVLTRVLHFYGIRLPDDQVIAIVARVEGKTTFDLKKNLTQGTGTARKGNIGEWRRYFTEAHINRFKEACGDFLVQLGYERDAEWASTSRGGGL